MPRKVTPKAPAKVSPKKTRKITRIDVDGMKEEKALEKLHNMIMDQGYGRLEPEIDPEASSFSIRAVNNEVTIKKNDRVVYSGNWEGGSRFLAENPQIMVINKPIPVPTEEELEEQAFEEVRQGITKEIQEILESTIEELREKVEETFETVEMGWNGEDDGLYNKRMNDLKDCIVNQYRKFFADRIKEHDLLVKN